jgi:hypothetical protein
VTAIEKMTVVERETVGGMRTAGEKKIVHVSER